MTMTHAFPVPTSPVDPYESGRPADFGAGAMGARLLSGPHTQAHEWLYAEPNQALADEIRELAVALRCLSAGGGMSAWVAAAVGAPLLRALLVDVAQQLRLPAVPATVSSQEVWDLVAEPLRRYFHDDDVADGGRTVSACLDLFTLVAAYGAGHQARPDASAASWFLDREAVARLVEEARGVLTGFATGVAEGKNTEAEIAEHFELMRDA